MKNIKYIITGLLLSGFLISCSEDFLEYKPEGVLSNENVATAENAESLVIAAYAGIANDDMIGPLTHMWVYGSVRSDDSYKGGGGRSDVGEVDRYEQYYLTVPDQGELMAPRTWTNYYKAISRINFALSVINDIPEAEYEVKTTRQGELRFLRAHCHFMLKRIFKKIPYITEDLTKDEIADTGNDLPNNELWNMIADDFLFAYNNLPEEQDEVGRADRSAAAAYLAKTKLYQAYEQDENNQVVSINSSLLQEVINYTDEVIGSLEPDYANNFLVDYENGPESIWQHNSLLMMVPELEG